MAFKPATRYQAFLRMAILGPAGSGKTPCALTLATELAALTNTKIAVIDTETGSASKYKGMFSFDVDELTADQSPRRYVQSIAEAEKAGYGVLVIDSLSHAWAGREGSLERVDQLTADSRSKNSFDAWRHVSRDHNRLVMAVLSCQMHVIATMRVKTAYVVEANEQGKNTPRKVGLQPIMRDGVDYEFDVSGELDSSHYYYISKSRCPSLWGNPIIEKPGVGMARDLYTWLSEGEQMPAQAMDLERRLDQDESRAVYEERVRLDKATGRQERDRPRPQAQAQNKQGAPRQAAPRNEGGQTGAPAKQAAGAPAAATAVSAAPARAAWAGEKLLPEAAVIAIFKEWMAGTGKAKTDINPMLVYPLEVRDVWQLPKERIPELLRQISGSYQFLKCAPGALFITWRDRLIAPPPAPPVREEPHVEPDPNAAAAIAAQDAGGAPENPEGKGDAFEGPDPVVEPPIDEDGTLIPF